jgi:cell pole-organizing protein PopZ
MTEQTNPHDKWTSADIAAYIKAAKAQDAADKARAIRQAQYRRDFEAECG